MKSFEFIDSVDACMNLADQTPCADAPGFLDCRCACLSAVTDCDAGFDCGLGCFASYCL